MVLDHEDNKFFVVYTANGIQLQGTMWANIGGICKFCKNALVPLIFNPSIWKVWVTVKDVVKREMMLYLLG